MQQKRPVGRFPAPAFFKESLVCHFVSQLTPSLTDKLKGCRNQEQKPKDMVVQGLRSSPGKGKPCARLLILSCLSCREARPVNP